MKEQQQHDTSSVQPASNSTQPATKVERWKPPEDPLEAYYQGVDNGREEMVSLIRSLEKGIATEEGRRAEATRILEGLKSGAIDFYDACYDWFEREGDEAARREYEAYKAAQREMEILKEKEAANN
jgi:hypothetical protein